MTASLDDIIRPAVAEPAIILSDLPPAALKSNGDENFLPTVPAAEQTQSHKSKKSKFRIATCMVALFCTLFISALNFSVTATAIPRICAELQSAAGYAWIGGAAVLASGAATPIWIKISDIFGRKPILLSAVGTYFIGCIICATAANMAMLIVGRAVQGAAAGGLIQLVTVTVSDLFSMRRRPLFLGIFELAWAIAAGTGPVLGGVFTELVSWRWIFWMNLPVAGLAFILLLLLLDVHNPRTKMMDGLKAIDWFGGTSIVGLMIMVLLGLNFGGETLPWNSATVICLIVFGGLMSLVFIYCERVARFPIMPLDLFKHKSNVAILVVGFTQEFTVIATTYYLPLYFQSAQGASPTRSGYMILPLMLAQALSSMVASVVMHRTGKYVPLIWIGTVVMTIGNGLYIRFNPDSSFAEIFSFQVLAGIGQGLLFLPPIVAIQAVVSQKNTATATATLGFIVNLSTALGIVLGGIIFQNGMQIQVSKLEAEGLPNNITRLLSGNSAAANVMVPSAIQDPRQSYLAKDSFAWSLRNLWIMCTCLGACGVIASIFVKKNILSKDHVETKTGIDMHKPEVEDR